ncbi:extracellular solute-binding protein [Kineosporia sp. A_224]|uniref:sugar ABC transporter substrate-binding protein n=1 Tax=Kineosporia sp. A_224 TaxID=1962180 RepID=UPI000B4AA5E5|nr:extracellular solute-binding protein [Kineosporia sp. A_224]
MASSQRRRFLGAGSVGLAAALLLSACGSGSSTSPSSSTGSPSAATSSAPAVSGALTIWTEDYYVKIFEPIVKPWAAKNGLTVTFVTKDFGQMGDQFVAAVPAGKGPDIFISPASTNKLVSNGVVAPVELGDTANAFSKESISAVSQDGKIYGVPFTVENLAMFRNTALAPTAPTSFDDAFKTGQALVKAGKAKIPFAVGLDPKGGNPYMLMPLQSSFGSTIFGTDANGNFNPDDLTIGNEQGQAFAKWLAEAGKSGAISNNTTLDIALQTFKDGKTPYLITGPWDLGGIKSSGVKFSIDPVPSAGGQVAAPFVGNYAVYQSSQSKNPLAASLFLTDFMTQKDTQVAIWKEAQNPPALTAALDEVSADPNMKAFGEIGATAVLSPSIPAMDQVWGPWGLTQVAILNGQGDPVALWKAMAAKIEAAITKSG